MKWLDKCVHIPFRLHVQAFIDLNNSNWHNIYLFFNRLTVHFLIAQIVKINLMMHQEQKYIVLSTVMWILAYV